MKLLTLKIQRMPGFKERGFSYGNDVFQAGINVIIGKNGSGKTTSCLAVRKIFWPEHPSVRDLAPVSLFARLEEDGKTIEVEIEGKRRLFSSDVLLPTDQSALCYTLLLDDIFSATDLEFAKDISKMAFGGCDLEMIRKHFAIAPRFGQREKKLRFEKRRKLEEIARDHLELQMEEDSLTDLYKQLEEAKLGKQTLEKVMIARELQKKRGQLQEVDSKLMTLPAGSSFAREEDYRDYQHIVLREGGEKPVATIDEEQLHELEGKVRELQDLERELKEEKRRALEIEVDFKERFSLYEVDKQSVPRMGPSKVGQMQQLWESWHAQECQVKELEAKLRTMESQSEPGYAPESLREGVRLLGCFLQAEKQKWVRRSLWAAPVLSLALYERPYICLGAAVVSFAIIVLLRMYSSSFFKRAFLRLDLPEPDEWTPEMVKAHAKQLETLWGDAVRFFRDKETAQIIATQKKSCTEEADRLFKGLEEAGFSKSNHAWVPFLHGLQRAQDLFFEMKKQEALVSEAEMRYGELLEELSIKNAHEGSLLLSRHQREWQRQKELKDLSQKKSEICQRCKVCAATPEEEWEQLRICVENRETYLKFAKEKAILEEWIREKMEKLQEDLGLLDMSSDALQDLQLQLQMKVSSHDQLLQRAAAIGQKLETAAQQQDFEEADAEVKEAERQLKNIRAIFIKKTLGEFLIDKIEKLYERDCQPDVFKKASTWFARFTRGAYSLQLLQEQGFGAFDAKAQETKRIESLSRGTRIQLILSIRLAFMELAESNGPMLPLFLDEAMSHADDERFETMIEALHEVARTGRQVFYFTCQRGSVEVWQRVLGHESSLFNVVDLDKMKRDELCIERPLKIEADLPFLPSPIGKSVYDYAKEIGAPGLSLSAPPTEWHLCHFVSSAEELYQMTLQNIHSYGQLKTLMERGVIKNPKMAAKGKLAELSYTLTQIGKGKKVSIEDLERGGVSDKFLDKVFECAKLHGFDGEKLLSALDGREVPGFREKSREELEESLISSGCLDRRTPLSLEEIRARLWHLAEPSLTPEETATFINAILSSP